MNFASISKTMEKQFEQIDPNLNADAYRNLSAADQPPIHDKQLEVIVVHKDGSLLLGASNMVDRYWSGSIWFYNEINDFDRHRYTSARKTESGVRAAAYLDKYDKLVIGEDSGNVSVFESTLKPESQVQELLCMGFSCQHDDSLTSLSTFSDNVHVVTGGMDSCIKVWDTSELLSTASFNQAQTDVITCVETQVNNNSVFVSTSMDSEALIWDTRKNKPASGLWKKLGCGLTSAAWKPDDENTVAIGGIDGSISVLDVRNTGVAVHESIEFPRELRRLLFNPECPTQLAGCCDDNKIKVFDSTNNYKSIFENTDHEDFVRDVAWYKSDLITCSWDNKVLRHSIKV